MIADVDFLAVHGQLHGRLGAGLEHIFQGHLRAFFTVYQVDRWPVFKSVIPFNQTCLVCVCRQTTNGMNLRAQVECLSP